MGRVPPDEIAPRADARGCRFGLEKPAGAALGGNESDGKAADERHDRSWWG